MDSPLCRPGEHVLIEDVDYAGRKHSYHCKWCPVEFELTAQELQAWRGPTDHLLRACVLKSEQEVMG